MIKEDILKPYLFFNSSQNLNFTSWKICIQHEFAPDTLYYHFDARKWCETDKLLFWTSLWSFKKQFGPTKKKDL